MLRILVTGGSGQVGSAIARMAAAGGIEAFLPTRTELDLENPESIVAALSQQPFDAVINCGAYTAVDLAESEPERARAINAEAPATLARETARLGIPLVQVSTDYVFDGSKAGAYSEEDPVQPLGVYGASKEAGERAVREGNPKHAVIRTAWVVSANGKNFINTMLRLGAERDAIGVVNDQAGNPSNASDIAEALIVAAKAMASGHAAGTWHFVNSGAATWHDLAQFVFAETAKRGLKTPILNAITTADYPTPAKRPANSQLSTLKFERDFGYAPRSWKQAIGEIMAERLDGKTQS
jgi:dTDP-4-dehydrorhamnose reductase